MSHYLDRLLKQNAAATGAAADDPIDPRIRDADGKQLVQGKNADPVGDVDRIDVPRPNLDLDLASTERRRAARARTPRKR